MVDKREATLAALVKWLLGSASAERIRCAFERADDRATYRQKSADSMTAELAFDRRLACEVWAVVGAKMRLHGYSPINSFDCDGGS